MLDDVGHVFMAGPCLWTVSDIETVLQTFSAVPTKGQRACLAHEAEAFDVFGRLKAW